jgi:hypothetical protein
MLLVGGSMVGTISGGCGGSSETGDLAGGGSGGADRDGSSGIDAAGGIDLPDTSAGSGGAEPDSATGNADATGSGGCLNDVCTCPSYQTACNGKCVPTSVDPDNCGGCKVVCMGTDVCSAAKCSTSCLPGLMACDRACADLENDNDHCGTCTTKCGAGTGCVNGKCLTAVPVGPAPAKCAGGGPPIVIDPGQGGCLGSLAQTTFRWALCSCTDLDVSAPLTTDAYDSTKGPYAPGELGGSIGVNRDVTHWSQAVSVGGLLWVSGTGEYQSSGPASEIKADLHLGGSWKASSSFTVDKNAYVVGTLQGVTVTGVTTPTGSVPPPCDCTPGGLIPVAQIVAAHRPPNNDNALIGLNADVFAKPASPLRLDLPCGNYYLTTILTSKPLTIAAHGRTALYIDGDVTPSAPLAFVLDPTAELDIFIAGTIKSSQTLVIGSPNYPALTRTYVGGTAKLSFSQDARIGGEFYAANSQLVDWSAHEAIYGAVFAGNFKSSQVTTIHYDRGVLQAGSSCPPPGSGPDGGTGTPDGSTVPDASGGGGCGTCDDCGNQACVSGACGPCTSDGDCCSPLQCISGTCGVIIK